MGSTADMTTHADEFWLFGYGSLIWKPPPHFDQRIPGWVSGYVRRFWQASQDHRGTPDAPGRVVTLIDRSFWEQLDDHHGAAPDRVWGVAYRIIPEKVAEVKDYLDIREINGYTIHYTPFHPAAEPSSDAAAPSPIRTLVYIGTPDNDQFVGPQDPQALAAHIRRSVGPSGLNTEYLFNLHEALENLSPESSDEHIRDLTERVRAIIAAEEAGEIPADTPSTDKITPRPGHVHAAEEEQEETEKSLIWKPPPHFDQRIPGWVSGYVRRFWQASQDHRGTPDAPGRVVTLIDRSFWEQLDDHHGAAPDRVWGVAYRIIPEKVAEVKDYLDIREINGYTIHYTPFHPAAEPSSDAAAPSPIRTLVYIGTPDNDQFVGPQDPQALAAHIRRSVGPSGLNTEYLFNLHEALENLSPESSDEHIRDLTERVRAIIAAEEAGEIPADTPSTDKITPRPGHVHAAEEEQEETEK